MKRLFLLALAFLLALPLPAFASPMGEDEKIEHFVKNRIVEGDCTGLALDRPITRGELAKVIVSLEDRREDASAMKYKKSPYADVKENHWANGFINALSLADKGKLPLLAGYEDGSFRPDRAVTYGELSKIACLMAAPATGSEDIVSIPWPSGWMELAGSFEFSVSSFPANTPALRRHVFTTLYDALEMSDPERKIKYTPSPKELYLQQMKGFNEGSTFDKAVYQEEILHLINDVRIKNNLKPLQYMVSLERGTKIRAEELAKHGDIRIKGHRHKRTDGAPFYTAFDYLPFDPRPHLGENLLMYGLPYGDEKNPSYLGDPKFLAEESFRLWMASPSHRANILDPENRFAACGNFADKTYGDKDYPNTGILVVAMSFYK